LVQIWIFGQCWRADSQLQCRCVFILAENAAVFGCGAFWNFEAVKSCDGHIRTTQLARLIERM